MKNLIQWALSVIGILGGYLGLPQPQPISIKPLVSIHDNNRVTLAEAPASTIPVEKIKKTIANDTAELLHESVLVFESKEKKEFLEQPLNTDTYATLHANLAKLSEQSPLFLLRECRGDQCSLSRFIHPENRLFFEDAVLQAVQDKEGAQLAYTSIGAGTLFQDFVILTKLAESGIEHLVYVPVDPYFRKFIKLLRRGTFKPKIPAKTVLNFEKINRRLYQFLSWFAVAYPHMKFDMYLFPDDKQYIDAVMNGSMPKSDVIVGVDLTPEPNAGLEAFNKLPLDIVLQKDGTTFLLIRQMIQDPDAPALLIQNIARESKLPLNGIILKETKSAEGERIIVAVATPASTIDPEGIKELGESIISVGLED